VHSRRRYLAQMFTKIQTVLTNAIMTSLLVVCYVNFALSALFLLR